MSIDFAARWQRTCGHLRGFEFSLVDGFVHSSGLSQVIGQRHGDAVLQRGAWEGVFGGKGNLAIANQSECVGILGPQALNQTGLAMNEQADSVAGLAPAEPDGCAAFWLMGEISGLTPF